MMVNLSGLSNLDILEMNCWGGDVILFSCHHGFLKYAKIVQFAGFSSDLNFFFFTQQKHKF